jgi:hypothetical protein
VAKNQEQNENTLTDNKGLETSMLTWEEELLSEILAANERLLSALRLYDDLGRLAVEPDVEVCTHGRVSLPFVPQLLYIATPDHHGRS